MNPSTMHQDATRHAMSAPPPMTNQSTSALVGDSPAAAPGAPDATAWATWRAGIRIAHGVAGVVMDLVVSHKIQVPKELFEPLVAGMYGLDEALVDVDTAFYNFTKTGDASAFTLDPPPIVAWPDTNAPSSNTLRFFNDALDILTGALQLDSSKLQAGLATHPELQIVLDAVNVLINSESKIKATIESVLDPASAPAVPVAP